MNKPIIPITFHVRIQSIQRIGNRRVGWIVNELYVFVRRNRTYIGLIQLEIIYPYWLALFSKLQYDASISFCGICSENILFPTNRICKIYIFYITYGIVRLTYPSKECLSILTRH